MNTLKTILKSFSHATNGLFYVTKRERNFQIELIFGLLVIFFIIFFDVKLWESVILILMITAVLIMELANTVIERVVDILKPKVHPYARIIKDIMAAVVMLTSFVAAIIGLMIFYPYVVRFMGG